MVFHWRLYFYFFISFTNWNIVFWAFADGDNSVEKSLWFTNPLLRKYCQMVSIFGWKLCIWSRWNELLCAQNSRDSRKAGTVFKNFGPSFIFFIIFSFLFLLLTVYGFVWVSALCKARNVSLIKTDNFGNIKRAYLHSKMW